MDDVFTSMIVGLTRDISFSILPSRKLNKSTFSTKLVLKTEVEAIESAKSLKWHIIPSLFGKCVIQSALGSGVWVVVMTRCVGGAVQLLVVAVAAEMVIETLLRNQKKPSSSSDHS